LEQREFYTKVGRGVFRAALLTVILLMIFSIIASFTDLSVKTANVYILVVTCLSVVYGAIYAAKKNNKNGWLVGILVALIYMVILHIISGLFFGDFSFETKDFLRFLLAVLVGALSGMLGINI
jgi:putative membrane protein (TIGR04086 family)